MATATRTPSKEPLVDRMELILRVSQHDGFTSAEKKYLVSMITNEMSKPSSEKKRTASGSVGGKPATTEKKTAEKTISVPPSGSDEGKPASSAVKTPVGLTETSAQKFLDVSDNWAEKTYIDTPLLNPKNEKSKMTQLKYLEESITKLQKETRPPGSLLQQRLDKLLDFQKKIQKVTF